MSLFFVEERFEISNLFKDIIDIIKLEEVLN